MAQTCTITSLASGMALTVAETGMLTVTPATGDVNQQFLITYGEGGAMRIATAFGASLFAGGAGKLTYHSVGYLRTKIILTPF